MEEKVPLDCGQRILLSLTVQPRELGLLPQPRLRCFWELLEVLQEHLPPVQGRTRWGQGVTKRDATEGYRLVPGDFQQAPLLASRPVGRDRRLLNSPCLPHSTAPSLGTGPTLCLELGQAARNPSPQPLSPFSLSTCPWGQAWSLVAAASPFCCCPLLCQLARPLPLPQTDLQSYDWCLELQ